MFRGPRGFDEDINDLLIRRNVVQVDHAIEVALTGVIEAHIESALTMNVSD
jgi:hypothetical protein